jgi:hypothetical protein
MVATVNSQYTRNGEKFPPYPRTELQVVYHNPRIKKILSFNTKKTLSLKIVS